MPHFMKGDAPTVLGARRGRYGRCGVQRDEDDMMRRFEGWTRIVVMAGDGCQEEQTSRRASCSSAKTVTTVTIRNP